MESAHREPAKRLSSTHKLSLRKNGGIVCYSFLLLDTFFNMPTILLATLLAALLERPFTRAAGFKGHALLYSVRANILSWFLGLLLAYASISLDKRGSLFFGMVFLAIPFSIAIEGAYLSFVSRLNGTQLAWKPIVFGNIFSGSVLLGVKVVGFEWGWRLQLAGSEAIEVLRDYRLLTSSTVMYMCIAIFFLAVFVPVRSSKPPNVTAAIINQKKLEHSPDGLTRE